MKRGLLIAGGTLGGLGAVMSITPPNFSATDSLSMAGIGSISSGAVVAAPSTSAAPSTVPVASSGATVKPTQSSTKAAKPTRSATKAAGTKASANSNSNSNANTGNTAVDSTPAAAATTAAPAPAGVSGTFVGPSVFVQYGNVQVQITVVNGRITDAQAIVAPTGKNDRYTNMAVPVLKKQTLAAQSSNIQGASGASYTSYGWFTSLQGALANAGL
jgi:uncharacterized protein with FMN-binding domain